MDDLQFERAEFGAAPPARNCTGCHQPIVGHYFDVNGQPFCEACTASIRQAHGDSPGGAAFGRALGAGLVAGAVGSSLYYLVAKISGYQLSIIAIAVGFLVGRGRALGHRRARRRDLSGPGGRPDLCGDRLQLAAVRGRTRGRGRVGVLDIVLQTPFILSLPIMIGLERPFSLVILGIGLWEAWKFTAPVPLAISGPFAAAAPGAPAPASPPPVLPTPGP